MTRPSIRVYTLVEHFSRWRSYERVATMLDELRHELWRPPGREAGVKGAGRNGPPWCNFGPRQLGEHTSHAERARRFAGRLSDGSLAAVLPRTLRPIVWPLALNPSLGLPRPEGGGRLSWARGEELWEICTKRLDRAQTLTDRERQRLGRDLAELDRGAQPFSISVGLANGLPLPTVGNPVAFSATALRSGLVVGGASWANYPVLGFATYVAPERDRFDVVLDVRQIA